MDISKPLGISLMVYACFILLMYISKPVFFFNLDESLKKFGSGFDRTYFTLFHVALIFSIMAYIVYM